MANYPSCTVEMKKIFECLYTKEQITRAFKDWEITENIPGKISKHMSIIQMDRFL